MVLLFLKGNLSKSGGVVTNIGIHFFDMLSWIFGDVVSNSLHLLNPRKKLRVCFS